MHGVLSCQFISICAWKQKLSHMKSKFQLDRQQKKFTKTWNKKF